MDQNVQSAVDALRDDARDAAPYFVTKDEVHFDPVSVVVGLASAIVISFLSGFEKAATEQAEEAGKSTLDWMLSLFQSKGRDSEKDEVEKKHTREAKRIKKTLSKKDLDAALDKAEASLRGSLSKLGDKKAAVLAKKVREVASREILAKD